VVVLGRLSARSIGDLQIPDKFPAGKRRGGETFLLPMCYKREGPIRAGSVAADVVHLKGVSHANVRSMP
jgi:hypothetical protein